MKRKCFYLLWESYAILKRVLDSSDIRYMLPGMSILNAQQAKKLLLLAQSNKSVIFLFTHLLLPSNRQFSNQYIGCSVNTLERIIRYAKKLNMKIVTHSEWWKNRKDKDYYSNGVVIFGFDDGYFTDYKYALPLFRKYDVRGTTYLIPKHLGGEYQGRQMLSREDILKMLDYGWDFQCHSFSHNSREGRYLADMNRKGLRKDFILVDEKFDDIGLPQPNHHAYPHGYFNQSVIEVLKKYRESARRVSILSYLKRLLR